MIMKLATNTMKATDADQKHRTNLCSFVSIRG
jgi:hypothetical protein